MAGSRRRLPAVRDGVVASVGESKGIGTTVIVQHDGGYLSIYLPCDNVQVRPGATVARNQVLADVGQGNGDGTTEELTFGLRRLKTSVDPQPLF